MRSSWYVLGGDLMITLEGLVCRAKWGLKCPEAHHTIEHGNVEKSALSALTGPSSIFQEPNRREAPSLTRRPHTRHSIRSDLPQETQRTVFLMIYRRMVICNLEWSNFILVYPDDQTLIIFLKERSRNSPNMCLEIGSLGVWYLDEIISYCKYNLPPVGWYIFRKRGMICCQAKRASCLTSSYNLEQYLNIWNILSKWKQRSGGHLPLAMPLPESTGGTMRRSSL